MPEYNFFVAGISTAFGWDAARFPMNVPRAGLRQSHCNHRPRLKLLTVALFPRVARGACAGFRCARTTATTTFDIFYRLQVTNFGLLKPAPNGLNYMNIRRLFPHGRCRLPHSPLLANIGSACQLKKGTFTAIKMALREKLDFLARML